MTRPFPIADTGPVAFPGPPPEAADLVVIGGGVVGVCTALFAARGGARVVLLEKGRIAAEQSSRNWGWIRVQGRDYDEIPVAQEAQRHWRALDVQCKGRLGLRERGVTYIARSDGEMAGYADWLDKARPYGVRSHLMSQHALRSLFADPKAGWIGALHTPTDMSAEAWGAVPDLARLAANDGVRVVERCAVRALDVAAGRVAGVVTEAGRIQADRVVLAGGAWSSLFLRAHGVAIPQLSVRSTALATGATPQVLATAGADDAIAMRPRVDGGYTLAPGGYSELFVGPDAFRHLRHFLPLALSGEFDVHLRLPPPQGWPDAFSTPRRWSADAVTPFERMRVLNPAPNRAKVSEIRRRFAQIYPQMRGVPMRAAWAGLIDVLPDVVPVVDRVDALPGLIVATGMSGHGFGIGPGFGRIVADLAADRDTGVALSRFRLSRFSDGSRLVPGPSL